MAKIFPLFKFLSFATSLSPGVFARTSLWYSPTILDDDDDDDDEEDDDEVEDNDKDDDNNDKDISALGLDRDMEFSRGHPGRQGHRPDDDDDDEDTNDKGLSVLGLDRDLGF